MQYYYVKHLNNATNIDHSAIPRYKIYHTVRDERKGGLAHYIQDEIHCTGKFDVEPVDNNIMDSCFVNIEINSKQIVLGELNQITGNRDYYIEIIKYINFMYLSKCIINFLKIRQHRATENCWVLILKMV